MRNFGELCTVVVPDGGRSLLNLARRLLFIRHCFDLIELDEFRVDFLLHVQQKLHVLAARNCVVRDVL